MGGKVLVDYFRMDRAKRTKKKWLDFEFVLVVQREDFVSVVWVWVGLRRASRRGLARTSGYGYRERHSTQINDQNKTQPEKESGMSTKRMRKRRKD